MNLGLGEARHLWSEGAGRLLVASVALIAVVTVLGMVALWPGEDPPSETPSAPTLAAEVLDVGQTECAGPSGQRCLRVAIEVDGRRSTLDNLGPVALAQPLEAGDRIRVTRVELAPGTPEDVRAQADEFAFVDVDRHRAVYLLIGILAVFAVLVLRWRGLLALLGVGLSVLLLAMFIVPAILTGRPALLVGLVGSLAVMFVTIVLTNGIGAQSLAAALGTTATLVLASLAALGATELVQLDGRTDELSSLLAIQDETLSLRGVVLGGMLIGALGVLADTAVTQASAVMALRRADPSMDAAALYRGAVVVGRDHLSATIHTLVLAYAGATLPLLLVLDSVNVATVDSLNYQDVAGPIAATVIGCLALIAAVPLTTLLASRLVARLPPDVLPVHSHAH